VSHASVSFSNTSSNNFDTVQDRDIVLRKTTRKLCVAYRLAPLSETLNVTSFTLKIFKITNLDKGQHILARICLQTTRKSYVAINLAKMIVLT